MRSFPKILIPVQSALAPDPAGFGIYDPEQEAAFWHIGLGACAFVQTARHGPASFRKEEVVMGIRPALTLLIDNGGVCRLLFAYPRNALPVIVVTGSKRPRISGVERSLHK